MRIGIASDHGGFALKTEIAAKLGGAGHEVFDFGAPLLNPADDYPDYRDSPRQIDRIGRSRTGNRDLRQRRRREHCCKQDPRRSRWADPRRVLRAPGSRR